MSPKTLKYLDRHIPKANGDRVAALEVGSADITGNCRKWFMNRGYDYDGIDIEPGPNVDKVVSDSCLWDLGEQFDVIVSLNTMEHVDRPWILVRTMAEHVVKYTGLLLIVAPFSFKFHRHPVDCWRYTPDSMQILADDSKMTLVTAYLDYEASALRATVSDIAWFIKRGLICDALSTARGFIGRPPVWNCIGVMRRL